MSERRDTDEAAERTGEKGTTPDPSAPARVNSSSGETTALNHPPQDTQPVDGDVAMNLPPEDDMLQRPPIQG